MIKKYKKILIATGIFPPQVGGPSQYAKNLVSEFEKMGIKTEVATYRTERYLPFFLRQIWFFSRALFLSLGADLIIALDTVSAGAPALFVSKLTGKKLIVRFGGDFLWESYVERTGDMLTIKEFYEKKPELTAKEKLIKKLVQMLLTGAGAVVFSVKWQKGIFASAYKINEAKTFIIENFYGEKLPKKASVKKNFIFAGRPVKLKNKELLEKAFSEAKKERPEIELEMIKGLDYERAIEKISDSYAAILPSLSEVSPNFILDAIRAGKPFILTRETGFYEKLKDIGLFVDPKSIKDIKEKIIFLADGQNYEKQKNLINGFDFRHSWEEIAEEFLAL